MHFRSPFNHNIVRTEHKIRTEITNKNRYRIRTEITNKNGSRIRTKIADKKIRMEKI